MPITDYRAPEALGFIDGFRAQLAVVVVAPVMWRLRAYWSRVIHRGPDSVEGHRVRD